MTHIACSLAAKNTIMNQFAASLEHLETKPHTFL